MNLELKGNELGWLLKLAEKGYMCKEFREWIEKYNMQGVDDFLKVLMCKVHPNNFNPKSSNVTWVIKEKENDGKEK